MPCRTFANGLMCGLTEAYITVRPFGTSFHYERRCANNHYTDHVNHAEVELYFGLPKTAREERGIVIDALTPSKRVAFNVTLRDRFTCVYCGCRAGEINLDGTVVVVGADHIIAKGLIDIESIRRDRDLLRFAKEVQLVTACRSHNSAKNVMFVELDVARELFIRHVLKNETRGANIGLVNMLERLHRLVGFNLRAGAKRASPVTSRPSEGS
jgi:hypothetical protein